MALARPYLSVFGEYMKSSYLRAGALACALGLSACGGSGEDVLVGGPVRNLTKDGLVLQNNGGADLAVPANASTFYFQVKSDSPFNITVKTSPPNATCKVTSGGTGTTSTFNLSNIEVVCDPHRYQLEGTVTGLGSAVGLEIINGVDRKKIDPAFNADGTPKDPLPFALSGVPEDVHYGVTVLYEPPGLDCSVTNGVGKMVAAGITNVQVNCVAAPAAPTNFPGA
jgi:hypothetical protein